MLCKLNETINYNGETYKRISLSKVKSLVKNNAMNDTIIYLITNNANLYSMWVDLCKCVIVDMEDLDYKLTHYSHYNHYMGLGNKTHYYIKL